jgi:hypothetical protein
MGLSLVKSRFCQVCIFMYIYFHVWNTRIHIVICWGTWSLLNTKMWRARVLETPFGLLLLLFTTSLVVTTITFYNVRSSLPCWFFILVDPLILTLPLWLSLVPLLWRCVFDLLLWCLLFWASPFFCSFDLSGFHSLPPWNRVLAPRTEDTLSKGYFSSVGQVVTGITSVNIRCSDNNCSPSRCLGIATVRSLFVVAGKC